MKIVCLIFLVFFAFVQSQIIPMDPASYAEPHEIPNNPPEIYETISDITIHEVASGRTWAHKGGIKQEMGAYKDGFAIHQITKTVGEEGNPDYIIWVNETSGDFGLSEQPTGYSGSTVHPGGMVEFDEDGYVYYTYGGRAINLPLDLYRSENPYDVHNFIKVLDNFETEGASTGPTMWVKNGKTMLSWRYEASLSIDGRCRHRRYPTSDFSSYEHQIDIGKASVHPVYGDVFIEQQWTRYDPRHGKLLASFSYFDVDDHLFGSVGWFSSDDYGDTWYTAGGILYPGLPMRYPNVDMPYDHLANGETTDWHPCEIALTPDGTPCMAMPIGVGAPGGRIFSVKVYFYRDGSWQTESSTVISATSNSFAVGATENNFVHLYARDFGKNKLRVRVTHDNGQTWDGPYILDVLPSDSRIDFISFFQPSDEYEDDYCRFIYSYYDEINDSKGHDDVRYIRFNTAGEGVYPTDSATNVTIQPTCSVNVFDEDDDTLTVYFYENTTGDWLLSRVEADVESGSTVYWDYTEAEYGSTTYYWKVEVSDGIDRCSEIYSFTTGP